jgi:hypothetical protein
MSPPPKSNNSALVPLSVENLDVKFPKAPEILRPKDAERTRNAISKHAAITSDAKVFYERDGIAAILATDAAGANKFVAERGEDEIIEDGKKVYVRLPSINQELSRRIQEPRDAYQLDRLRDAEQCLNAVRDAPELENRRLKLEARNRKEMPGVKRQVLKNSDTCISGESLQSNAEVHHVNRVADSPDLSLDPNNLKPVNPKIHDQIHAAEAHTPEALAKLAEQRGWPMSSQ